MQSQDTLLPSFYALLANQIELHLDHMHAQPDLLFYFGLRDKIFPRKLARASTHGDSSSFPNQSLFVSQCF